MYLTLVKVAIGEKTTINKTVQKWLTRWSLGSLEVRNGCPELRTGGMAVLKDWWCNCPDQSTGGRHGCPDKRTGGVAVLKDWWCGVTVLIKGLVAWLC